MIKYNDDNIYVGQIKQLLKSFPLPRCRVHEDGNEYAEGENFIKDGFLFVMRDGNGSVVRPYKWGDSIDGITTTLPVNGVVYDNATHTYLGDYLRFLRDYRGVDLMSMYNCFVNDTPNRISISFDEVSFSSDSVDYSIASVPVRFGHRYSIAVDWHGKLEMCCSYVSDGETFAPYEHDSENELEKATHVVASGLSLRRPFSYTLLESIDSKYIDRAHENSLRLLIKVPLACRNSIVVLEDFDERSTQTYVDGTAQRLGNELLVYHRAEIDGDAIHIGPLADNGAYYVTKNQLLNMTSQENYMLADRLVEYLSEQAVYPYDDVDRNIKRLQRKMVDEKWLKGVDRFGIWDEGMRKAIYRFESDYRSDSIGNLSMRDSYFDLLGYFDKDVESVSGGIDPVERKNGGSER